MLVVGAGNAGEMIVRDMLHNPATTTSPSGSSTTTPASRASRSTACRCWARSADLARVIEKTRPDDVLIAMPSAPRVRRSGRSCARCSRSTVNIITLPNLREIVSGQVAVAQIRKLAIEDLLARPPVGLDPAPVRQLIAGRCVMVTGAGGSIGSELCRQIAAFEPKTLLLFERYENTLFAIANELQDRWPGARRPAARRRRRATAAGWRACSPRHPPHIVFHAAAHKHVPLMELSPCEAVKNNVFGTQQLVDAA